MAGSVWKADARREGENRPRAAQEALPFGGPETCVRCGRSLAPVVVRGYLNLSAVVALGLDDFNAILRCWHGRCSSPSSAR
jgi:hypothetical protein